MLRVGVDLIEISRIAEAVERHGDAFLTRVFTPAEIASCQGRPASLAARWAAKEAAAKALGCGIGSVNWVDVEVVSDEQGAPVLRLHAAAAERAAALGLHTWALSLTHTHDLALAFVAAA